LVALRKIRWSAPSIVHVLGILALGSTEGAASESRRDATFEQAAPVRVETTLQLAQSHDVEVYIDEDRRQVPVDPFTTGVLGVEPADVPYRPRPQGQAVDESPVAPDATFPGAPQDPDAPDVFPLEPQPRIVTREPIERQPLDDAVRRAIEAAPPPADSLSGPTVKLPPATDVAELQVLLDRKGASPGVIDGRLGSNVDKALAAYSEITGLHLEATYTEAIDEALAESGGDAFISYTITPEDAAGPFVASVPADYSHKAKLDRLSFTSVSEMLGERFHMDEAYLKALNPDAEFGRAGTIVKVANTGANVKTPVDHLVADKAKKQLRAYDASGRLVVAYPATIGSSDTPSPSGTHEVARIAINPEYTYNPNVNFKQGDNDQVLTIPPGPNGPVGSVWIALSKPTYGIHGTPDPSKIGKTESHGCVRLTNWDASELAKLVKHGVLVQFTD
jgi:lipoprotein-anchoring transpeptidase ErfK/SrfK